MKFSFLFKSSETTTTSTTAAASWPWPSCATNSKTLSFREDNKTNTENRYYDEEMITGLRSERFFFEPGKSNSILDEAKTTQSTSKISVATMEIESRDPILDFRVSMEEMVEAHGLRDWESLERLLACYLKLNGKNNHRYIIGAFVDLLFSDQASSSSANCSSSSLATQHHCYFTSPLSFSSSSSTTYSSACN